MAVQKGHSGKQTIQLRLERVFWILIGPALLIFFIGYTYRPNSFLTYALASLVGVLGLIAAWFRMTMRPHPPLFPRW